MKSKMVRTVSIALALVMLLTLVAGCAPKEEATPTLAPTPAVAEKATPSPTSTEAPKPSPTVTPKPTEPPTEEKHIVRISAPRDPGVPNPYGRTPRGWGGYFVGFVFDSLIYSDEKGPIPWLAKDWEISDDGLTYTLTLRDDVKWHDGEKFTANDVVFTFDYLKKHKNPHYSVSDVQEVTALSDYKVEIKIKERSVPFLSEILRGIPIMPEHIWSKVDDPIKFHSANFEASLIGTGPYILEEYNKESISYRFVANADYWWGKPAVDEIHNVPVSQMEVALLNGDIDVCSVSQKNIQMFKDKPEFTIMFNRPTPVYWITFNLQNEVLGNEEFRYAIAHAINKQEFVDRFTGGIGMVGTQGGLPLPAEYRNTDVRHYDYDLEESGTILDSLGYKDTDGDGFREKPDGSPLEFEMIASTGAARCAELVEIHLNKAGIKVNIQTFPIKKVDQMVKEGEGFDMLLNQGGAGLYARDPDLLRRHFRPGAGGAPSHACAVGFNNEELNQLADAQRGTVDETARCEMVNRMQEIVAEELPIFYIFTSRSYGVFNNTVHDGFFYPYDFQFCFLNKLVYLREHSEHEVVIPK
jgi:peptide/nickel transport system substrate-binding protein